MWSLSNFNVAYQQKHLSEYKKGKFWEECGMVRTLVTFLIPVCVPAQEIHPNHMSWWSPFSKLNIMGNPSFLNCHRDKREGGNFRIGKPVLVSKKGDIPSLWRDLVLLSAVSETGSNSRPKRKTDRVHNNSICYQHQIVTVRYSNSFLL